MHRRGASVAEVLHDLFGPGEYRDHHRPRVIAAWAYATVGGVDELQPATTASGRRVLRRLVELLEQPVVAGVHPPDKPVWQCSLHNHADDALLSDQQWARLAAEFMAGVGLAPHGDLGAVRWLGIRHGDDHVHLVATLVRQDGRTVWAWNDYRGAPQRPGNWRTGTGCTGSARTGRRRDLRVDHAPRVAARDRRVGIEECWTRPPPLTQEGQSADDRPQHDLSSIRMSAELRTFIR